MAPQFTIGIEGEFQMETVIQMLIQQTMQGIPEQVPAPIGTD